jgi:hypothetical protein
MEKQIEKNIVANEEWKAWGVICYNLRTILKMTKEQFNASDDIRYIMECIEQWGFWEHQRRISYPEWDNKNGIFWDGEEIH